MFSSTRRTIAARSPVKAGRSLAVRVQHRMGLSCAGSVVHEFYEPTIGPKRLTVGLVDRWDYHCITQWVAQVDIEERAAGHWTCTLRSITRAV